MGRDCLEELCTRLVASCSAVSERFSIVLVDDRSPDNVWPLIRQLGQQDRRIRGIQMSRNFGQHYALTAGIDHARARWYVVMDCDLQDAPEDIPLLFDTVKQGFDIVVGVRQKEGHGFVKRHASRVFYTAFNLLAGFELDWGVGNYRIFSDTVAEGLRKMREQMRFFPASLSFMGFEVGRVELRHHPRGAGRSSYTFRKLAKLATNTILAHSQVPLKIVTYFGLLVASLAIAAGLIIVVLAVSTEITVPGWASIMVGLFVMGGLQIFITGVVGVYVGKTFEETKKRPLYFVRDTSNLPAA